VGKIPIGRKRRIHEAIHNPLPVPDAPGSSGVVFIIGGGPSLVDFNFSRLNGRDTIAVNKAILDVPNPKYFVTVDYTFIKKCGKDVIAASSAIKFFVVDKSHEFIKKFGDNYVDTRYGLVYEDLDVFDHVIEAHKQDGFGYDFGDFRTGLNSGYCAVQLAIALGYKTIYLFGFDLSSSGNKTHYHEGYGLSAKSFNGHLDVYLDKFLNGLTQLNGDGKIKVCSCSSSSRLNTVIPYVPIDEALC
jgi:hypothetical protein